MTGVGYFWMVSIYLLGINDIMGDEVLTEHGLRTCHRL